MKQKIIVTSWIDLESGHLNEIRIHDNSIEYDEVDKEGSLVYGEEIEMSPILTDALKGILLKKINVVTK